MSAFGSTTKVPSKRQNDLANSVNIMKIKEFKIRDLLLGRKGGRWISLGGSLPWDLRK
jgi:hypothetical protein